MAFQAPGREAGQTVANAAPLGGGPKDNVVMPDLDPASVIEAVTADQRLRAFTGGGRIETMPARQSRRRLLLDRIAQAFEPGVRYPQRRVSLFLRAIYADYAALRRYLVDEGFLSRADGRVLAQRRDCAAVTWASVQGLGSRITQNIPVCVAWVALVLQSTSVQIGGYERASAPRPDYVP
jgi:hypothetical protein